MLTNCATPEGTAAYASRFADLPGNFRTTLGLTLGSIGIGTYLGESDDAADERYAQAIRLAILSGVNVIDTAINYRYQRSERVIGRVLKEMVDEGEIRREEIVVATKGGYIAFDGEPPENPRAWFEQNFVRTGMIGPQDLVQGSHCMTPRYLDAMIEASRANLGLNTIDFYYIHNPETQVAAVGADEFSHRMRAAFELLESKVNEGWISFYGTATWNGYRIPANESGFLSLPALEGLAQEVAGADHHFRVIQLPYSLAMPEALTLRNQTLLDRSKVGSLAAADALGIAVCASAPLLQGQLTRGLPKIVGDAFESMESDAQRSIQFVRSTPGVDVALLGMGSVDHVRHNLATAKHPPASFDNLMKLFDRSDD